MKNNFIVKDTSDLLNMLRIFRSAAPPLKEQFSEKLDFAAGFAKKLLARNHMLKAHFCVEHMRVKFETLVDHSHLRTIKVSVEEGLPPEIEWISPEGNKEYRSFNELQIHFADEWYERVLKEFSATR